MKQKHYIYAICLIVAIMVGACLKSNGQTAYPGRVWLGAAPPATVPVSPNKFQTYDIWRDTVAKVSYRYKSGWYKSTDQLAGPTGATGSTGAQGPVGPAGKDGICPACPTGTGTGFPTIYGKTAFPTNEAEYVAALKKFADGTVRNIVLYNDIALTKNPEWPDTVLNNPSMKLDIDCNNYGWIDKSPNGIDYCAGRFPEDQTEADNVMQSWAITIHDGYIQGQGAKTKAGIRLGATYNSAVYNFNVMQCYDGIVYQFCLMGTIRNCLITNCTHIGVDINRGPWPGVGTSNSQSNHVLAEQVRVFNADGAYAAFNVVDASGVILRQDISEGGTPQYHIVFNSMGATVVKDFCMFTIHLESPSSIAAIKGYLGDQYFRSAGVFSQYDNVLFDLESVLGYPHVYIADIPWMTSGSFLKNTGTAVIWHFSEVKFDPSNKALWVGGLKPYYWSWEGFNQSPFYQSPNTITINQQTFAANSTLSARLAGQPYSDWDIYVEKGATGYDVVVLKLGVEYRRTNFGTQKQAINFYNSLNTSSL